MRRVKIRSILMGIALSLGACSPIAVPIQLQPFPDVPVPAEWTPYSDDWAIIRTQKTTTAASSTATIFPILQRRGDPAATPR